MIRDYPKNPDGPNRAKTAASRQRRPNSFSLIEMMVAIAVFTIPALLLANNVLGLWFQALDGQGNPIQQGSSIQGEAFDSPQNYAFINYLYTNAGKPGMATHQAPVSLCSIQVAIIVLDSRAAQHLTGSEKPSALTGNFWGDIQGLYNELPAVIKKGAEIQTTAVDIAGEPHQSI